MFDSAEVSRAGGRTENQDAVDGAAVGRCQCWVLADGLGGHRGGEVAARVAIRGALDAFRARPEASPAGVAACIEAANQAVVGEQQAEPDLRRMRTTIVVLIADRQHAAWGHVGDARLYRLEGGTLRHRTRDHSVSQALVDAGEIPASRQASHEDRDRILRALGTGSGVQPTIVDEAESLYRGDAFLLCSDGFWEAVSDTAIEIALAATPTAEHWIRRLEHRVLQRTTDGSDNYSAVAVRLSATGAGLPPPRPAPSPASDDESSPGGPEEAESTGRAVGSRSPWKFLLPVVLGAALGGGVYLWRAGDQTRGVSERSSVTPAAVERQLPSAPAELGEGEIHVVGSDVLYETLDVALTAAGDGGEIWLGPGRHTSSSRTIDRELHLRGAGRDDTIIDLSGGGGLVVTSDLGSIIDLALCCAAEPPVLTLGGGYEGLVASVRIGDGGGLALRVSDRARPTLEDTNITGADDAQVSVEADAAPVFVGGAPEEGVSPAPPGLED